MNKIQNKVLPEESIVSGYKKCTLAIYYGMIYKLDMKVQNL